MPVRTTRTWRLFWAVLAGSFLLIASRRIDALTRAQFYAEDGIVWYAQAYTIGPWRALLLPRDGYLQTLPRMVAAFSLAFPLTRAPLVMNIAGLLVQALPAAFLLSARMKNWGPLPLRCALAFIYIALPNAAELHASITEAQWHLALAACLLTLAQPPSAPSKRVFDFIILLLCGLSGPFVIPLAAIAVFRAWRRRDAQRRIALGAVLVTCAALQAGCLLFSHSRAHEKLGANLHSFLEMLAAQIFAGALVGRNALHRRGDLVLVSVAAAGTLVLMYSFRKASLEWRLFLTFCACIFAASLANPTAGHTISQWSTLSGVWDSRYWFFPMLAFVWSLIWCVFRGPALTFRIIAAACLVLMLLYLPKNWRLPPAPDVHFGDAARRFERARRGEIVKLPVLPPGWTMELQKK